MGARLVAIYRRAAAKRVRRALAAHAGGRARALRLLVRLQARVRGGCQRRVYVSARAAVARPRDTKNPGVRWEGDAASQTLDTK